MEQGSPARTSLLTARINCYISESTLALTCPLLYDTHLLRYLAIPGRVGRPTRDNSQGEGVPVRWLVHSEGLSTRFMFCWKSQRRKREFCADNQSASAQGQ